MAKIFYKKKLYDFEKDCEDEFGKYHWYFRIYRCFSLEHLEKDNPRYYRLKENVIGKGLHNKLW